MVSAAVWAYAALMAVSGTVGLVRKYVFPHHHDRH